MTASLPTRLRLSSDEHLAEIELGGRCQCDMCAWMHKQAQTCREAADALEQAGEALREIVRETKLVPFGDKFLRRTPHDEHLHKVAREALAALGGQEGDE